MHNPAEEFVALHPQVVQYVVIHVCDPKHHQPSCHQPQHIGEISNEERRMSVIQIRSAISVAVPESGVVIRLLVWLG